MAESVNLALLELAAEALGELCGEVVFVGGATIDLWITDEAAPEVRPTDDVDVIVEVATRRGYQLFEEKLRNQDFAHDLEDGVICRFRHRPTGLVLDAMPAASEILGFDNRWHGPALEAARKRLLASRRAIRVVAPPYLLATKLEAFRGRGNDDMLRSRDFGDVVALIDGRAELVQEVADAPPDLRQYLAEEFIGLLSHQDFEYGVAGHLKPDDASQRRADLVVKPRMDAILTAARSGCTPSEG